jgi:hypothetical protein
LAGVGVESLPDSAGPAVDDPRPADRDGQIRIPPGTWF